MVGGGEATRGEGLKPQDSQGTDTRYGPAAQSPALRFWERDWLEHFLVKESGHKNET